MTLPLHDLRQRYLRAQLAGDRREAVRIVVEDGLGRGQNVRDLQTQVIQAAQQQIGALWQKNEVSIAQEHMATQIAQLTLAALFERAHHVTRLGKSVLIACINGELHDLPARFVADLLDLEGFDVKFLGADVPHEHLVGIALAEKPDLVGLSVTMSFNLPSARIAISRLRDAGITNMFIGGHATTWSKSALTGLGATVVEPTPDAVVATAKHMTGLA